MDKLPLYLYMLIAQKVTFSFPEKHQSISWFAVFSPFFLLFWEFLFYLRYPKEDLIALWINHLRKKTSCYLIKLLFNVIINRFHKNTVVVHTTKANRKASKLVNRDFTDRKLFHSSVYIMPLYLWNHAQGEKNNLGCRLKETHLSRKRIFHEIP